MGLIAAFRKQNVTWNEINYIKLDPTSFYLRISIEFYTRVLMLPSLSDERLYRLNLINDHEALLLVVLDTH